MFFLSFFLFYFTEFCQFGQQVNQTPDSCKETKFKVINLEDGVLYRFRVMAVNAAGESNPANLTEPIRVQDRLGELLFQYHRMLHNATYVC